MKRLGAARRAALARLAPTDAPLLVDVGADHGHVAHAVGGVATERRPNRLGRRDVPWVVADGLLPFREVPAAIIAGMGALTIEGILERGPLPTILVTHAPDDPRKLRRTLKRLGYRIVDETLAWEGRKYAEIIRAEQGDEPHEGLELEFGPVLLHGDEPHLQDHLTQLCRHQMTIARATADSAPEVHEATQRVVDFLSAQLTRRGWPVPTLDD